MCVCVVLDYVWFSYTGVPAILLVLRLVGVAGSDPLNLKLQ